MCRMQKRVRDEQRSLAVGLDPCRHVRRRMAGRRDKGHLVGHRVLAGDQLQAPSVSSGAMVESTKANGRCRWTSSW